MADLSIDATVLARPQDSQLDINRRVVIFAILALAAGAIWLGNDYGWHQGALFLVGGGLGIALYHALFGFTSAWRVFIADRRGAGLRAQMVMLAVAVVLFFPLIAQGSFFGQPVKGEYGAVGISVIVGAFLFGLGMQLGGGCASGTLYTAGGGNTRMFVTLAAFIFGSAVGAAHLPWWQTTPSFQPVSLVKDLGLWPALILNLAALAAIAAVTVWAERRRHGKLVGNMTGNTRGWRTLLYGPWPLVWGAVGLAIGNFLTLILAGRPWGITSAFALWGSKFAMLGGMDVDHWGYWVAPARNQALHASVFSDITSIMDFGIMLGALLASGLAGKFSPQWKVPARSLIAAVVGGLMLGYGARLAYGCNIGAFFSGIASSSLHGWLWFASALLGSIVGTRLRPLFDLTVEKTTA
ncbi:MAG TPA: YeeE/YedE family protein [Magnetospirillaceae bacterium]|jgi:hypothetical protein